MSGQPTPIQWHEAITAGRRNLSDAPPAVKSWFRLHLFLEACKILDMGELEDRRSAIAGYPESYREELKEEVVRLWRDKSV